MVGHARLSRADLVDLSDPVDLSDLSDLVDLSDLSDLVDLSDLSDPSDPLLPSFHPQQIQPVVGGREPFGRQHDFDQHDQREEDGCRYQRRCAEQLV